MSRTFKSPTSRYVALRAYGDGKIGQWAEKLHLQEVDTKIIKPDNKQKVMVILERAKKGGYSRIEKVEIVLYNDHDEGYAHVLTDFGWGEQQAFEVPTHFFRNGVDKVHIRANEYMVLNSLEVRFIDL